MAWIPRNSSCRIDQTSRRCAVALFHWEASAAFRWAVVAHITRIVSEFVVLLATLLKLFGDTRIDTVDHALAEGHLAAPPPPPPPPPPPGSMNIPLMLLCLSLTVATLVASILATGGVVQLLGGAMSTASSGTSVWSRVSRTQRSGRGQAAAASLVPRRGQPSALSQFTRVAPAEQHSRAAVKHASPPASPGTEGP